MPDFPFAHPGSSGRVLARLLPWAALALMVIFFFMQVDARTRAERGEKEVRKELHELRGARALVPTSTAPLPGASTPGAPTPGRAATSPASTKALEEAHQRAAGLASQIQAAQAKLERANGVLAAQAARAKALEGERDAAASAGAAVLQRVTRAEARAGALASERDTGQGALAATTLLLAQAEARAEAAEAVLGEVQAQIDPLLRQAQVNMGQIARMRSAAVRGDTAKATVRRWLAAVGGRSAGAGTQSDNDELAAALLDLWGDERTAGKKLRLPAYAEVLASLAPSEVVTGVTLSWLQPGMADRLDATVLGRLVRRHMTGHLETMHLLLPRYGAAVHAVVLERLPISAQRWNAADRAAVVDMLAGLLVLRVPRERRVGALGLGKLAAGTAAPALIKALADKERSVRHAAAWALTQLARTPVTVAALRTFAKTQLASPAVQDVGEGLWIAQWVLGQPQNVGWLDLSDAQIRRVAKRLRARLDG